MSSSVWFEFYPYFFSFFLLFFLFYRCFPWQTRTIHKIGETGEGIITFLVFHFHLLTNIHLIHRDFYHLFLVDLFAITRLIAYETPVYRKPCMAHGWLAMHGWSAIPEFYYLMWFFNLKLKLSLYCRKIIPLLLFFCFWSRFLTFFLLIPFNFMNNYFCP